MTRNWMDWAGNIVALLIVIAVNWMANALPIGGQTTGGVSDKYPSLFTPDGFTFAIWGLIYLSLTAFVIYQALPAQRGNADIGRIGIWFKLSCAANALWIFAWHYDLLLISLLLMFGLLAALIRIYRSTVSNHAFLMRIPFSLYTGWITVATIANISVLQSAWGLNDAGLSAVQWTWLKMALAGAIGAMVVARTRDTVYLLVIAWAAFGIFKGQSETPEVAGAAATISILAILLAGYTIMVNRKEAA